MLDEFSSSRTGQSVQAAPDPTAGGSRENDNEMEARRQ